MRMIETIFSILVLSLGVFIGSTVAHAHPHVWVTYELTVDYTKGAVTGVEHVWTFDDMYTAMAIEGLDKNNDGKYDREELAELAKVNMEGLKDFHYFTFAKLGDQELKFLPPQDAWLEHNNGILRLHFRLPLEQPVLAEAEGLSFSVHDPSFYIAFEPEQTDAIRLASAPTGCTAKLVESDAEKNAEDAKRLGEALAQELGGQPGAFTGGGQRSVAISCKKS